MPFNNVGCRRLAQGVAPVASLAAAFLPRLATQAAWCRLLLQPIARRRFAAIVAILGQLTTQINNLLRLGSYQFFKLSDPAQSRVEEVFISSNLVHSTTDSEKSSQRHEIPTTHKN
jgi:hypothetical protein